MLKNKHKTLQLIIKKIRGQEQQQKAMKKLIKVEEEEAESSL